MGILLRPLSWCQSGVIFLVSACVTINVYFPAAAAERAADEIIQDVWGDAPTSMQTPTPETSAPQQGHRSVLNSQKTVFWQRVLNVVIPSAQAAANININTPEINRLRTSMAARFKRLAPYFSSGAVGLTRNGLLAVRDLNAVPLQERRTVTRWVAEDNDDRNALYREIAEANNHPEWESQIRAVFAREWIDNARTGWWYQSPGGWVKK